MTTTIIRPHDIFDAHNLLNLPAPFETDAKEGSSIEIEGQKIELNQVNILFVKKHMPTVPTFISVSSDESPALVSFKERMGENGRVVRFYSDTEEKTDKAFTSLLKDGAFNYVADNGSLASRDTWIASTMENVEKRAAVFPEIRGRVENFHIEKDGTIRVTYETHNRGVSYADELNLGQDNGAGAFPPSTSRTSSAERPNLTIITESNEGIPEEEEVSSPLADDINTESPADYALETFFKDIAESPVFHRVYDRVTWNRVAIAAVFSAAASTLAGISVGLKVGLPFAQIMIGCGVFGVIGLGLVALGVAIVPPVVRLGELFVNNENLSQF